MKARQALVVAIIAGAIAAPFDAARFRSPSAAHRRHVSFARRRNRVAQFTPFVAGRFAREGRSTRRLDLHLHQLDPHPPLRARMGRQIQGSRDSS